MNPGKPSLLANYKRQPIAKPSQAKPIASQQSLESIQTKPSPAQHCLGSTLQNNVNRHSHPRYPCKTKEILPRVRAHTRQAFETSWPSSIFPALKMQPKSQPKQNQIQPKSQPSKARKFQANPNPKKQAPGNQSETDFKPKNANRENGKNAKPGIEQIDKTQTRKPSKKTNRARQLCNPSKTNPASKPGRQKSEPKRNAKANPKPNPKPDPKEAPKGSAKAKQIQKPSNATHTHA